jgi:phage virion morphogenesis protein
MKRVLLRNLAEEARLQVVRGFEGERDPYGKAWQKRKATKGRRVGGKLLRDTARMMNSITPRPFGVSAIRVTSNVQYAAVHNYGGKRMPKRQFLPDNANGLGPIWGPAFEKVAEQVLKDTVRR